MSPLIEIHHLHKHYFLEKKRIFALHDLSLAIYPSETLGLVGESGCGKSTLGRCLLRLETPTRGTICYAGKNLLEFSKQELFSFRRRAQIIFQDPYSSLNPRMTALDLIAEPLYIHQIMPKQEIPGYVASLLDKVALSRSSLSRFPHEFSGGQRQRIGIARALALKPQFLVCDEPISALDVSVQAQIINLLKELQHELGLTYLFIAHDLATVKYLATRVAVMYLGHLIEIASTETLYRAPQHPYTQLLFSSIPDPHPKNERTRSPLKIISESALHKDTASSCPFAPRCPHAFAKCYTQIPSWQEVLPGHAVRCHLHS